MEENEGNGRKRGEWKKTRVMEENEGNGRKREE